MADNSHLLQLLALRKQLLDKPGDSTTGETWGTTNLTSPEEYQQMPPELQNLVKSDALNNPIYNPFGGFYGQDQRMAEDLQKQEQQPQNRFQDLMSKLKSYK